MSDQAKDVGHGDDPALWFWIAMGGTGEGWDVADEAHRDEYRALARRAEEG